MHGFFLSQIKHLFLKFSRRSGKFKNAEQSPQKRLLVCQGLYYVEFCHVIQFCFCSYPFFSNFNMHCISCVKNFEIKMRFEKKRFLPKK